MYHPLNKITCPPLNKLNDLARLTLQFGLTQTLALPDDQIHQSFVQHFNDNGYPNAGKWLWGKPVLVRQYILTLVALPIAEKQDVFNVYLQNQDLDDRFADGAFIALSRPPVSDVAYNNAAELSKNFYKILGESVPSEVINEAEQLDRQIILRAYLDAQKEISLKVCPGCDGTPPSISDGNIHEDIDHFFPKSKYPFLSIHPLNLTPFCKDCNQTYKKSKDAILDDDPAVADVKTLRDIYHPYENPAKADLSLELRKDQTNNLEFFFNSQARQNCLHSLQYTLDLEKRWTGDLEEERIEVALRGMIDLLLFGSQDDRGDEFQPDQAWLKKQLSTAIKTLQIYQGRQYHFVPTLSYAKWIESDEGEQKKWLNELKIALI